MEKFIQDNPWIIILIVILAFWDTVWTLIALWKSARGNQLIWFVCLGIFNTIGILPIIYLLFFRKKEIGQLEGI
jgi:hypothetical protein